MNNQHQSWGNEFWNEIIPRSAHSLTELKLRNYTRLEKHGPWSYGPQASDAIRQCTSLRKLDLSLSNLDEDWARIKGESLKMLPPAPGSITIREDLLYGAWWQYIRNNRSAQCTRTIVPRTWALSFNCVVSAIHISTNTITNILTGDCNGL